MQTRHTVSCSSEVSHTLQRKKEAYVTRTNGGRDWALEQQNDADRAFSRGNARERVVPKYLSL
jgi:hypothetical protein